MAPQVCLLGKASSHASENEMKTAQINWISKDEAQKQVGWYSGATPHSSLILKLLMLKKISFHKKIKIKSKLP